jgi:outer membrane protein insertion porin family
MYELPLYTIEKSSISGNKHVKIEDLKSNINSLKDANRPYLFIKLNGYLSEKRNKKDSLKLKEAKFQFFNRKPEVLDTLIVNSIRDKVSRYYSSIGYLNAQIRTKIDTTINNKVKLEFLISEGKPSLFTKKDTLIINNPALENIVKRFINEESLIKKNTRLSISLLKDEKKKLGESLRNQGYYYFSEDQIGIKLNDTEDSTLTSISLAYKIPNSNIVSTNAQYDRLFRVGLVKFNELQLELNENEERWISKPLSTNQLKRIVTFKEGDMYAANRITQSLQNIYATDQYKSVTIKFDTGATRVNPTIDLIRNDKYNVSSELGGSVFRGIPGPFITNTFKIRRVFSVLDNLELSSRIGFEAQTGFINTDQTRKNLELNLTAVLNLPTLYVPTYFSKWSSSSIGSQTQFGLGYDYINRPEYLRTNFKIFQRYQWRKSVNKYFQLSLFDVNIINTNYPQTETSTSFTSYLESLRERGNNLYRSFNPSFVSSIIFQYNYRSFLPTNKLVDGKSFQIGLESGGTTLNLIGNKRIVFIEKLFESSQELQFYRYLRFNLDYRKYVLLGAKKQSQIAFKFIGGLAYVYGSENDYQLPYEKNFFIGGPSSLRAWKPRRLGPGSYNSFTNLIEQPGSVLIESSLEYRFKIVQFLGTLNGALFLDAGNIWNISYPNQLSVGNWKVNSFLNEIALGTGVGLRWDFDYFLLRLDLASKMINPAMPKNEKWVFNKTSFSSIENPIEFNIGIGYPF